MDYVPRLEVHYYLQDHHHSMDAMVRNRCEAEFLSAISHITHALGVELRFEATVPAEGGFRDIWRVVVSKATSPAGVAFLVPLLSLVVTQAVTVWNSAPKPNPELEKQQLEINQLTIQHWKLENQRSELEIRKLKREDGRALQSSSTATGNDAAEVPAHPSFPGRNLAPPLVENASPEGVPEAVGVRFRLQLDPKVVTRRSNFYKQLVAYDKVTAVGVRPIFSDKPLADETVVHRAAFGTYILQTNLLEPEVRDAIIEIVSPVISEGSMKWKGRSNGEVISFTMSDLDFKRQVFRNEVSFQHGDSIRCVLETDRKLDEAGNETVTGYRVTTVLDKIDGNGNVSETARGKRKRFADKHRNSNQSDLFSSEET